MNTLNTSTANTTGTGGGVGTGSGSSTGNKIKGAMQAVHGLGENIRGTALGAVDTVGNKGYTENDEIARRGRVELEQGKANMQMPVDRAAPGAPGYGAGVTNTHAGAGTGTHTGITGAAHHPGSGLTGNQVHNVPPLPPRDAAQGGHGYADDVAPHNVGGGAGTTTNYNRS